MEEIGTASDESKPEKRAWSKQVLFLFLMLLSFAALPDSDQGSGISDAAFTSQFFRMSMALLITLLLISCIVTKRSTKTVLRGFYVVIVTLVMLASIQAYVLLSHQVLQTMFSWSNPFPQSILILSADACFFAVFTFKASTSICRNERANVRLHS
jgi:cation transport ATPase